MLGIMLYSIGKFLSLRLPLNFLYKTAVFLADLHYFVSKKDRDSVKDNLRAIFPEKKDKEIVLISREAFRNFAKYLVDFFRFDLLNKNNFGDFVTIENLNYLDEALKLNCGVIVLTAHIGNWELGGATLGILGYNFSALVLPHKQKKVNEFFNRQRNIKGVTVIQVGQSPMRILRYLKENYIVAILGDRDFTSSGIELNFFGKNVYFPRGAAFFSIKSGAPIILGFMIRENKDKFRLIFEKPIFPVSREASPESIDNLMQEYLGVIAKYIKLYPEQWFMFRRFWEKQTV